MARRFRFSLQRVFEYRLQVEEQAKMLLAKAQMAYQAQAEWVQKVRGRLNEHDVNKNDPENLTTGGLWLWTNYRKRLVEDIARAEMRLMELAQILNQKRREAVAKAKERKLLEKLKETQARRHAAEEQRKEQAEFDEMATIRYKPQAG